MTSLRMFSCLYFVVLGIWTQHSTAAQLQETTAPVTRGDSCVARCDESYFPGKACYCNEACDQYENCCFDYYQECLPDFVWSDDWLEHNNHLYKFFSGQDVTGSQARTECRKEGGLLVSINDQSEMEFISLSVLRKRTLSAFVGGKDEGGVWMWQDGTPMPLPTSTWHAWYQGQPQNNDGSTGCAVFTNYKFWEVYMSMIDRYIWRSHSCDINAKTIQGYICERTLSCEPSPCLNGGVCLYVGGDSELACGCVGGFVGDRCQYELVEGATWTECGPTDLTAGSDVMVVTSPLYPQVYPPNTQCSWNISTEPGKTIQISITDMDIEAGKDCVFDQLTVYDGDVRNNNSVILGPTCGTTASNATGVRESFTSSSNTVQVVFSSDQTVHRKGFSLSYSEEVCGQGTGQSACGTRGLFTAQCGSLEITRGNSDPQNPCEIVIQVAEGLMINITFKEFNIFDSGKTCPDSALMIYDGEEANDNYLVGSFCGFRFPWSIQSRTNNVILKLWGTRWTEKNRINIEYSTFAPNTWTLMTSLPYHTVQLSPDSIRRFNSADFSTNLRTGDRDIQQFSLRYRPGGRIALDDLIGDWDQDVVVKIFDGYDQNARLLVDLGHVTGNNLTSYTRQKSSSFHIFVVIEKPISRPTSYIGFNIHSLEYDPVMSGCYRPLYSDRSDDAGSVLENHPVTGLEPVVLSVSEDFLGSPDIGYDPGLYCKWTVRGEPGQSLVLSFLNADIPPLMDGCDYDGVVVYDRGTVYGPFCGSSSFGDIMTSGNDVDVVFYSDSAWGRRHNGQLRILFTEAESCAVHQMETVQTRTLQSDCGVVLSPGLPGMVPPGVWTWIIEGSDVTKYFAIYVHYVKGPGVKDDCDQYFKVLEVSHDAGTLKQHESPVMTVCGSTELFVPTRRLRLPRFQKIGIELNTLSNSIAHHWEFKLSYKALTMDEPITQSDEYSCPENYVYWRQSCYKYYPWVYRHYEEEYDFQQTWQRSLEHCEGQENGTLLTLRDEDEANFIKYMLGNDWFWDRAGTYQSNGRLIFIGLHNKYGDYQWMDGSQLSYADWYVPRQEWEQPILYTDTVGTDFLDLKNAQPTADVGSLCTALIVTSPFDSLNWAKIPCDYPIFRSGLICEQKATRKETGSSSQNDVQITKRSTREISTTTTVCPPGWIMIQRSCFRLLTNFTAIQNPGQFQGTRHSDARQLCVSLDGDLASVDPGLLVFLRTYLTLWRHEPITGHIWIAENSNHSNYIKVFRENEQDENTIYALALFLETDEASEYPRGVLCQRMPQVTVEACTDQEFECRDKSCISVDSVCDGHTDCPDDWDEMTCGCGENTFTCDDGQCISISLYCDFRPDCKDGSDESICLLQTCTEDQFTCTSGQCIHKDKLCDFKAHCEDGSDEDNRICENNCKGMQCFSGTCIHPSLQGDLVSDCPGLSAEDEVQRTLVTFFDLYNGESQNANATNTLACGDGDSVPCRQGESRCYHRGDTCIYDTVTVDDGRDVSVQATCRDGAHLRNKCDISECAGMFHCPGSFCIPHRKVCDGVKDCPEGAEEANCSNYTCPGMFRCKGEKFCIPHSEVCDGTVHCPKYRDDEKYCQDHNSTYVEERTNNASGTVPLCARGCTCAGNVVDCTNVGLSGNLTAASYPASTRALLLSGNQFQLDADSFRDSYTLGRLVLSYNQLKYLPVGVFRNLHNLYDLDLSFNNIESILPAVLNGLISLKKFNLDHNSLLGLARSTLAPLVSIHRLVITNNILTNVEQDVFMDVPTLRILNTDSYKFCCIAPQTDKCTPEPNEFSSCDDLMANYALRVAIWVLGFFACIGNLFVVAWRLRKKTSLISSFFIVNLGCSDFLMGVYMLIIASVDMFYRGRYIIYDDHWRSSALCQIAGILAMLSSEVSVFMLTAITVDRVINIMFPLKRGSFRMKHAKIVVACGWVVCFFLSVIPATGIDYFGNVFFGKTGVCLPFQVSNEKTSGWEYAVFIFLAVNLASFVGILIGYTGIFVKVKESIEQMREKSTSNADEYSLAKKLMIIVATDFMCWVPIIIIGIAALSGAKISPQVSAWIAVFILPLNSAINPLLYTISALDCRNKRGGRGNTSNSRTVSTAVSMRQGHVNVTYQKSISDRERTANGTSETAVVNEVATDPGEENTHM